MVLSLKDAKNNLINAQKEAARAYKNVEEAREVYNNLLNKSVGGAKKRTSKKSTVSKKRSTSSKKKTITKKRSTSSKSKKSVTKKRSTSKKSASKKQMRGGGGSDWLNTVNSRGNVAGPNDHWGVNGAKWFNQFEKTYDYASMSELRRGSYELQKAAAQAPKIPTGNDVNALQYQVFGSGADLGTQRA